MTWIKVAELVEFAAKDRICVELEGQQIAIFHCEQKWFAVQNLCPHQKQLVLAKANVSEKAGELAISCPLHKAQFSLETGKHLADTPLWTLKRYQLKLENDDILIQLDD